MPSSFPHPKPQKTQGLEWAARLIPGTTSTGERKKPQREAASRPVADHTTGTDQFHAHNPSRNAGIPARRWLHFILAEALHIACVWFSRIWQKVKSELLRNKGSVRGARNVLVVGAGAEGRRLAHYLETHPERERTFCGFLEDRKSLDRKSPAVGIVGRISDLAELARTGFVDEVILVAPRDRELTLRVLHAARELRLDVKMVPDLFGCRPTGEIERIGEMPLISLHEERLPLAGLVLKRSVDIAVSGAMLILLAPALALLALIVRLDSPGPVLYAALRAGRKGRPFRCYKFRTMIENADSAKSALRQKNQRDGPCFKIRDDPRITRLGHLLRRYSIDELPQLWNVLKGEMSLVGPRPHTLDDFSGYGIEHLSRLDVTPGITGLWQVTARRDPSFKTGMNLDIDYIHRWSLAMDFKILWKTAAVVMRGNGE